MTKPKICVCSTLLFIAAALAFGADLYSAGSVAVALPSSGGSVHDVLLVSDRVLGPYGFVRGEINSVNTLTPDRITVYSRASSLGNPTACDVLLRNGRMVFSFLETGIPRSNSPTGRIGKQLATALIERYNAASVEVQLK